MCFICKIYIRLFKILQPGGLLLFLNPHSQPSDCLFFLYLINTPPNQLPQYASTASMFQPPEMASAAPTVASQPGVTNKVSAWLQQTEDIDATTNGQQSTKSEILKTQLEFLIVCACVSELIRCQAELSELAHLIQRLHWLEGGLPVTSTDLEMRINVNVSHAAANRLLDFTLMPQLN